MNSFKSDFKKIIENKAGKSVLIKLLSENSNFDIFNNFNHKLGAFSGKLITYDDLANFLIDRSQKIGPDNALNDVLNYLNIENLPLEYCFILYQTHIEYSYEFSNGVKIKKIDEIQDENLSNFILNEQSFTGGRASCLLTINYNPKKCIYNDKNRPTNLPLHADMDHLRTILDDTRLLISLARNSEHGISVVCSTQVINDSLQFLKAGVSRMDYYEPRSKSGPSLLKNELEKTDDLINQLNSLSEIDKSKIRVVLKRLNDSKIDADWANKCINLRICLENLFCSETEFNITKSIKERAPRYTNYTKTNLKNIYSHLSDAVHTGINKGNSNISENELIRSVNKVITQFLKDGCYPKWSMTKKKSNFQKWITAIKNLFWN